MSENIEATPTAEPKQSLFKSIAKGAWHVAVVAWTVPAVRSVVATNLIRFGLPGTLVALGVAIGEKLGGM
jgi:hypothetical protein